ncbi:hypothetical protein [Rubellimicrobium sp. CFH 75288]|uniref:hypothetical protein n=1 Tax=Rubellimicrobium sp. CFH 75288 TaxID=2697034 RepID=UPI001412994C|nr:hypothetical protein [Rubellimicrobium sp. CFH 75288]NAZ36419.1 hypothetical protein [Rubellimicrobium sp. CFH 75288]
MLLATTETDPPDPGALARALAVLPPGAPVVALVHGYRFRPGAGPDDPFRHILSLSPDRSLWGAVSWPRRLGLGGQAGLALGFGWDAKGSLWRAHARAAEAGAALAQHLALVRRLDPGRPVGLLAHSLGARVAAAAMMRLPPGSVRRAILLAAALSRAEALALAQSPSGRTAEIVNVTGAENRPFDWVLRAALPWQGPRLSGGDVRAPGWLDLPLDCPATLGALARAGWRIPPPSRAICHWSGYLRPGIWRLYRSILLEPDATPWSLLCAAAPLPASPRPGRSAAALPPAVSHP